MAWSPFSWKTRKKVAILFFSLDDGRVGVGEGGSRGGGNVLTLKTQNEVSE